MCLKSIEGKKHTVKKGTMIKRPRTKIRNSSPLPLFNLYALDVLLRHTTYYLIQVGNH